MSDNALSKQFVESMSLDMNVNIDHVVAIAASKKEQELNVLIKQGNIKVDETSQSNVPSIYAIGDVTDRINLTPVAIAEGHAFADSEFGNLKRIVEHTNVASAVFSQPPIASIGLSEADAKKTFGEITCLRIPIVPSLSLFVEKVVAENRSGTFKNPSNWVQERKGAGQETKKRLDLSAQPLWVCWDSIYTGY